MQVFATSPAAVYTGVGNAFTRISSTEGMRALWRGVSSVIMGAGPAHAVHFGTYEMVKEFAFCTSCRCALSSFATKRDPEVVRPINKEDIGPVEISSTCTVHGQNLGK